MREIGYCFKSLLVNSSLNQRNAIVNASSPAIENVLAVLHINHKWGSNIPIWMSLYSKIFPNVVAYVPASEYCGELSTVEINCISTDYRGYFAYESMIHEIKSRKYNPIQGFLFTHDAVSIDPFLFHQTGETSIRDIYGPITGDPSFPWWFGDFGRAATRRFITKSVEYKNFTFVAGQADFYYVTKSDAETFVRIAQDMREANLFLEIAVPAIFHNSIPRARTHSLCTSWAYVTERAQPLVLASTFCAGQFDTVHQLKLSTLDGILAHMKAMECSHLNYRRWTAFN